MAMRWLLSSLISVLSPRRALRYDPEAGKSPFYDENRDRPTPAGSGLADLDGRTGEDHRWNFIAVIRLGP